MQRLPVLDTAEWHNPHTLHVTKHPGGPPDPKYDKKLAQLPKTAMGMAQDVYVYEETAVIMVSCLPSSATALYHVPGSVTHTVYQYLSQRMGRQGCQARMWSALNDWKQEGPDRWYNPRSRVWKVTLKHREAFTPSQHVSVEHEQT